MGNLVKRRSLNRRRRRKGSGLLNTIINKLPVELHIPGYRFCGPGTKLEERLERGDKGVNDLDEACKLHDIAYSKSGDLSERHIADKKLYNIAIQRLKSADARVGEKIASVVVAGAMKGKTKLGMGARRRDRKGVTRHSKSINRKRSSSMKRNFVGGSISFMQAMRIARNAIKRAGSRKGMLENVKVAFRSLRKSGKKILLPRSRIIPIPKTGGFLPLIPIFAALGALGSLGGGAAAITNAVNSAKAARDQLQETKRHNIAMESKAGSGLNVKPYKPGCGVSIGSGLYIKPYKSGCGVYLPSGNVSKNG